MSDWTRKTGRPKAARKRPASRRAEYRLVKAARGRGLQRHVLRLYVSGTTPSSTRVIGEVRRACEEHLRGRYELEVFDIYQMPVLARDHQIIATPTLIRVLPSPLRRFIGDLSNVEKVLFGIDLREKPR